MSLLPDKKTILSEYVKLITETVATFMQSQTVDTTFHQRFKNLLEISITSHDNIARRLAEDELEKIRENTDIKAHTVSILQIVYLLDKSEKTTSEQYVSYLVSYIRRFAHIVSLTDEAHLQILACVVCVIINKEFPVGSSLRPNLSHCFELLIENEKSLNSDLIKLSVGIFVNSTLHQLSGFQMIGALFIIRILLNKIKDEEYFTETAQKVIFIANNIFPELANLEKADPVKVTEILKIFGLSVDICYKIVITCYAPDVNLNLNPIISEGVIVLFDKILLADFFKTGNSLICFHIDSSVCDTVNSIKHNIIRGLSKVAESNYQKKPEELQLELPDNDSQIKKKLHSFYENLAKYLLREIYLAMKISIDRGIILANDHSFIAKTLMSSLSFLAKLTDYFEFYPIFTESKEEIMVNVLLMLLTNLEEDYKLFADHPSEFINIYDDLVDKRASDTLKSASARLLFNYCNSIDGSLSFLGKFLLETLYFSVDCGDYHYELIQNFKTSPYIHKLDNANRIETSLLCLTIIQTHVKQRGPIDHFLSNYLPLLANSAKPVIKQRLCLFLKYYTPALFPWSRKSDPEFKQAFQFLFTSLIELNSEAISYQALNTLASVTKLKGFTVVIESLMNEILPPILKLISEVCDESHFHYISELFLFYGENLSDYAEMIIKTLVDRVFFEFKMRLGENKNNMPITKCLQIIEILVAQPEIVKQAFASFEQHLEKLFQFLDIAEKILFDEYIINILDRITGTLKNEQGSKIYPIAQRNFEKVLENFDNQIDHFFFVFHNLCTIGNKYVSLYNPQMLGDMIKVTFRAFGEIFDQNLKLEYLEYSKCCLMIQQMIQCFSENGLIKPHLPAILNDLAEAQGRLFNRKTEYLSARFSQIYYCAITYHPNVVIDDLKSRNRLGQYFGGLLEIYCDYFEDDPLATKIAVEAIATLLFNLKSAGLNEDDVNKLFNVMINLLKGEIKTGSIHKNLHSKRQLQDSHKEKIPDKASNHLTDGNYSDDSDLDKQISTAHVREHERKIQELIQQMRIPFREKNEIKSFQMIFNFYKENFPKMVEFMVNSMDKETKTNLHNILNSTMIDNQNAIVRKVFKPVGRKQP